MDLKVKLATLKDMDEKDKQGEDRIVLLEKKNEKLQHTTKAALFILRDSAESLESKLAAEVNSLKHIINRLGDKLSELEEKK